MLADNKLTDLSGWDEPVLALHLKELSELALDFDVEAIGFEWPEIDLRVQSLDNTDGADKADDFVQTQGPAVSQVGDIWVLGKHRLFCGSALDRSAYDSLLQGTKAAAIFIDPPYNVRVDGHVGGSGAIKHREFVMASGEMSSGEFCEFLKSSFALIASYTDKGALIYGCMDWRHQTEMLEAGSATGLDLINLCIWVKSNGGMGSLYRSRHELIYVFRNGKERHRNNVQLGRFGRNRTNVWNYAGANSFSRKGRKRILDLHPTHQANRPRFRRPPRFDQTERRCPGSLFRKRHNPSCSRTDGTARLWHRTRRNLRRHRNKALGKHDRESCKTCIGQAVLRNAVGKKIAMILSGKGFRLPLDCPADQEGKLREKKGRARHGKGTVEIIDAEFSQRLRVYEGGIPRTVTVFEAIITQLVLQELAGNKKATRVRQQYEAFAAEMEPAEQKIIVKNIYADWTRKDGPDEEEL